MYLGKCVEKAPAEEIFRNPVHPYTKALLAAIPIPSIESCHKKRTLLQGEVTSPINPKPGCRFAARCPLARELPYRRNATCRSVTGTFLSVSGTGVTKYGGIDNEKQKV